MTVTITHDGTVAIVTVDNPPVNALSQAVRQGLWDAVATLDVDAGVTAVVLCCAGRTFIAGADVKEFGKPPEPPHLPDLVARIEGAAKPWVAAIHGSALGGGLEVTLGCRFRLAAEGASLGLPEVSLGIVPGAGGTVRTPRLVGVHEAVGLVTSGRPVPARKALEIGLIDRIVEGDLQAEAVAFARNAGPAPRPLRDRDAEAQPPAFWAEREAEVAKAAKGAAAPLRALASIRKATEVGFDDAMAFERATFLELRASDEAAALRRLFFAERAATRPPEVEGVEPRPLQAAGVVGGGTMGAGIAVALLEAGLTVRLVERDDAAAERGRANVTAILDGNVKRGRTTEQKRDELLSHIGFHTDYDTLAAADLVIEAVFEDIAVKREVFATLSRVCAPQAVLATNTSYLDPRRIAPDLPHPERFIGLHFFSPANVMKLLEIVPLPDTAPEVLATAFALARRMKKMPVRAGICDGFIGNRILKRYRSAAEALVRQGVPIVEIDAAMRAYGFAMGPFEAQDLGGLDIAFLQREGARAAGETIPETLGDVLVRAGRTGKKSGSGWYDYKKGSRTPVVSEAAAQLLAPQVDAAHAMTGEEIAAGLVGEMAAEGEAILTEGIAASAVEIDLVKVHGYGFPRWRGGPMFVTGRRE